ncbi:DUF3995 domain-containing protein [Arthrobacter caoxuetaonis]|uniref:DUF3995 domain-containing protein n=1 Tax=Arthrobacter caoxuetaonis TaxID=2886935 RepID=UPI001D144CDE|nr:DUF3995 domain-containing protein [Arthrobacter caoxuetaonis]MCC3283870.1 DUF3995 domain-containing protein [Arthrobacter caoxuetaonis]
MRRSISQRRHRTRPARGRFFLWAACALGLIHAGFSLYWALGGRWLLATVGQFAVQAAKDVPLQAALLLAGTALLKAAAAVIPLAAAYGRFPFPGVIRVLSWIGGAGLVVYGGVNTAAAAAVLAGWIPADPEADSQGLLGHALLWDPLFLGWGACLLAYLFASRPARTEPGA